MAGSSYPSGFKGGVQIRGVPLSLSHPGEVFWVNGSTTAAQLAKGAVGGSDGNDGSYHRPFATLQKGIDSCSASRGDIVMVMPSHAETVTSQIDMDTAGVAVIGLGHGNMRPTITPNGAIDAIDVSAANCMISNIIFAIPGTDAQTADINVDAAGCTILDTLHHGSTTSNNKVSIITVTANGDDLLIDGCRMYNDTVDVVSGIELAAASRVEIANCLISSSGTVGYSTGCIDDTGICTDLWIHHCQFKNVKAATAVVTFASNSVGLMSHCNCSGRHTTIASNVVTGTGMDFFENRVTEEAALNGAIIPAADAE